MSNLAKRIAFAAPAAAFFLYVAWLGGPYFYGLIVVITLLIQQELQAICAKADFQPDSYFIYTIALWVLLIPVLPHAFQWGVGIFLIFVGIQLFKQRKTALQELISTLFCSLYVSVGMLTLIIIRNFNEEVGFGLVVMLLLMIWGNDVFAYFGGKSFGEIPLAPAVSPNKTWAGFIFGFLGAGVGFALSWAIFDFNFSWILTLPLPLLVSIFGPLGDLTESKLKRAAGVKDASNILPGHGGFLDRFDALILASPACYLYLYILEVFEKISF